MVGPTELSPLRYETAVFIRFLYFTQMNHVEERFGPDTNKEVLLMCIGITSGVGRLIFGRVADYVDGVNKVYLQVSAWPQRLRTDG